MISWTIALIKKNKETFLYLFFGGLTVLVNIAVFTALDSAGFDVLFSNTIAFFIAVAFAYYTNTKYVFESQFTFANFTQFFGMRITTILIDNGGMFLLIYWGVHKLFAKIIVNVVIIILNYICSKFFIFKKERKN